MKKIIVSLFVFLMALLPVSAATTILANPSKISGNPSMFQARKMSGDICWWDVKQGITCGLQQRVISHRSYFPTDRKYGTVEPKLKIIGSPAETKTKTFRATPGSTLISSGKATYIFPRRDTGKQKLRFQHLYQN